ncbi:hypothetical protein OCHUTO_0426 [Orientia chuto str. Dubai]|uniref:Uncharacterized protein n=1 Tax=Orientia chuto str. Dubai TaxID=1359168 RepID=A0A0F3MLH5_9RICK|nr:hypothetical protein OCHUTO_0426 [Orientia chuto str. Dubai]
MDKLSNSSTVCIFALHLGNNLRGKLLLKAETIKTITQMINMIDNSIRKNQKANIFNLIIDIRLINFILQ